MMIAGLSPHFMRGAVFWCEGSVPLPRNAESQSRVPDSAPKQSVPFRGKGQTLPLSSVLRPRIMRGKVPNPVCAAQYFGARDQLPFRAVQRVKVGCSGLLSFVNSFLTVRSKRCIICR